MRDPQGPITINPFLIAALAVIGWVFDRFLPLATPVPVNEAWINFVVQIAIMIVSAVITAALAPKPKPPKPASLGDFDAPTAEEGRPIPVIFGTVWCKGPNVLWYGDLNSVAIKSKGGKK